MIPFSRFTLNNGLRLLVYEDNSTPMATLNVLYNVGSRDEDPEKTGFAHLFEHLMFGGSQNVKDFDKPLQRAGGDSNAFTNSDYTNFYDVVPTENLEIAFWLESDRMLGLNFSQKSLETQRKVVVEEFKETCLTEPYGDMWHRMSEMAYKVHPYRFPTIGKEVSHIENATLEDVKSFFYTYYRPDNAIISVAGNITAERALALTEKWFSDIPRGNTPPRQLPIEPPQTEMRKTIVEADVPVPALYMAFHMPDRLHEDFYTIDLLSDVLCTGDSSRFIHKLIRETRLFSAIDAFVTGSVEAGLFMIEGRPSEGVSLETASEAIWKELKDLQDNLLSEKELQKFKNKVESNLLFSEYNPMGIASNLAFCELLGDANFMNEEAAAYQAIRPEGLQRVAREYLREENCSVLWYVPKKVEVSNLS
jgi:zinc protease